MKKILMADDDFLVRSYLSQIIDWKEEGYELVGVAQDGAQALEMARNLEPDILLTDIEMPISNGIELLKALKKEKNQVKIIILSCHDDFEYVKEALQLGADDYLLKDTVTPEKLLDVLNGLQIEKEKDANLSVVSESDTQRAKWEDHAVALLEGRDEDNGDVKTDALIAVRFIDYEEKIGNLPMEHRKKLCRDICENGEMLVEHLEKANCIHIRGGLFAILCKMSNGLGRQVQYQCLRDKAGRTVRDMDRYFELKVKVGVSDVLLRDQDLKLNWNRAVKALGQSFFQPGNIFYYWQGVRRGESLPTEAGDFLDCAKELYAHRDSENIKKKLALAMDSFLKEQTSEEIIANWMHSADQKFGIDKRSFPERFEGVRELVEDYISRCEEKLPNLDGYSDGVALTIRFIQEHYHEDISLSDAAYTAHLTTTYLSFAFHKETGITFSEYLQSCRINHAKELLSRSGERIQQVGLLVGYNDARHFGKVFKKVVGITPQEYRKQNRKI